MEEIKDPSDSVGFTEALGEHATYPTIPSSSGETLYVLECRQCSGVGCDVCGSTGKQKWKVSADETRIKASFEMWVRTNARTCITEADQYQLPQEASEMRKAYAADFAAGKYTWDGEHAAAARNTDAGMKQLLYLMILRCHPNITPEQVDDMFVEDVVACVSAVLWSLGNFKSVVRKKALRAKAQANAELRKKATTRPAE